MSVSSCETPDLLDLFQGLLPDIGAKQHDLDNPTRDFISLFYQQFVNKLYFILSNAVKDIEPDEGKKTDFENIYSLVRFINFTMAYVYPNIEPNLTFRLLLPFSTVKLFKIHARTLLKILLNFEKEFLNNKELITKRLLNSKELLVKREELNNLKKKVISMASETTTDEKTYGDLQKAKEKIQNRFKKLQQQQDQQKQDYEKLKVQVKTIVEEHDNLQVLLSNIQANIQNLNKQIVLEESYKRSLSLKENLNVICTELKNEEGSIQENLRGKKLDIDRFTKIEAKTDVLNDYAKELTSIQENYYKQHTEQKLFDKKVQVMRDNIQKLNCCKIQLSNKIKNLKETIHSNGKNSEFEEQTQVLTDIKQTIVQEKEDQQQKLKQKRDLESKISNINKSCMLVKNNIEHCNVVHKHYYENIITIENDNIQNLNNALDAFNSFKI